MLGTNTWVPLAFHACNRKGKAEALAAVDLCLEKLGLDYVDLMLIHCPCTSIDEVHFVPSFLNSFFPVVLFLLCLIYSFHFAS